MNAADFSPRTHAFVLDAALKTPAPVFTSMAPDLQAQLREDVSPKWGVGNGDIVETTAVESTPPGVVPIRVHATAPADAADSGAEAEHGDLSDGTPDIDVFEDLILQFGIGPETPTPEDALAAAISHELVEARVDSDCQRQSTLPGGKVVAVEACDQVQAITYKKGGTTVSNFNLPSNFALGLTPEDNVAPFDFLGAQTEQFQCMPGGYEQWLDPSQGWQMITADRAMTREEVDAMPTGMARYRAELSLRGLGRHSKRKRVTAKRAKAAAAIPAIVATREYPGAGAGPYPLFAEVLDNGTVRFVIRDGETSIATGTLGHAVLEQLAELARGHAKT